MFGRGHAVLTLKAALCAEEVRIYAVDLVRVNTRNTYPCPETNLDRYRDMFLCHIAYSIVHWTGFFYRNFVQCSTN